MLDIGKIALTYDIKRMDEVESFHNAWLSGQFIKRLLLLSRPVGEGISPDPAAVSPPLSPTSQATPLTRSDRSEDYNFYIYLLPSFLRGIQII